jgi:hypothetical protein
MLTKEKIDAYIAFFDDDKQSFYNTTDKYIEYDKTVDMFIKDCYNSNMMDTEYMSRLEGYIEKGIDLKSLIEKADTSILKAILTFYIRGERFSEGMVANAIDKKIFVTILKKLN